MSLIAQPAMLGLTGKFSAYSPLVFGSALKIWFDAENVSVSGSTVLAVPNGGALTIELNQSKPDAHPEMSGAAGAKIINHDSNDLLTASEVIDDLAGWTIYAVAAGITPGTFLEFGNPDSRMYFTFGGGWYQGDSPTVNIGANNDAFQILKCDFDDHDSLTRDQVWYVGDNQYNSAPIIARWKTMIGINRKPTMGEQSALENWLAGRL